MSDSSKIIIICPGCQKEISIDDALRHQLVEQEKLKVESEYKEKLENEKKKMWAIAVEKAEEKVGEKTKVENEKLKVESEEREKELGLLKEQLELQKKKRAEAEEIETKLRKERVQFEEDQRAWKMEQQRQLDAERAKIKEDTIKTYAEETRLKEAETVKRLQDALKANEDLRRKLEQGSQQAQGEVLEIELEDNLRSEFPIDEITPVPKGINGADVTQKVRNQSGRVCGSIVWELKRTKAWSEGWIQKLKDDQRAIKADIAILITQVLPDGVKRVGLYSGVYIAVPEAAIGLAQVLRHEIIKLAGAKSLEEGKMEKKEVIYNYLCGPEFRGRVEAVVEAFVSMKDSLERERRAFTKLWAEREKQIDRAQTNMIGMYGDMQGIAGTALPQIKSLELPGVDEEERVVEDDVAEPIKEDKLVEKGTTQQLHF